MITQKNIDELMHVEKAPSPVEDRSDTAKNQPQQKKHEGISPENSEFSSASMSGTDIALPNSQKGGMTFLTQRRGSKRYREGMSKSSMFPRPPPCHIPTR